MPTGSPQVVLRSIRANPRAAGMIAGDEYAYSNYRSYARPADDGLSAWHPAYLRLGRTLDGCARRYEQFCRRYRPEAKEQRRSGWGGWRLWREIEGSEAGGQADLFGASGARHRGGGPGAKRARPVAVLRPGVLREVDPFLRVNAPAGGAFA